MKSKPASIGDHDRGGEVSAAAAVSTWREIQDALAPYLGSRAIDALFDQSVQQVCEAFPWLNTLAVRSLDPHGCMALREVLSGQTGVVADRAHNALVHAFKAALAKLIGDALSESLLRNVSRSRNSRRGERSLERRRHNPEPQSTQMTQVVEQLVLAAIRADAAAEAALRNLDELARASQRDPLTDTPNRAVFLDRLESAIAIARRRSSRVALLFIDLDDFKQINDALGHAAGDEALKLVAGRLTSVLRSSDTVCRYGGDEFLVLLPEVATAADANVTGCKILAALATPAAINGHTLRLSASLGIGVFPDDAGDAATLIGRADTAMYRAKRKRSDTRAPRAERVIRDAEHHSGADVVHQRRRERLAIRRSEPRHPSGAGG